MSVDILLMTCNRLPALIASLSSIASQSVTNYRLIVSDGSQRSSRDSEVVQSLLRIITARGATVSWFHRPAFDPLAEHNFLLEQATGQYILCLDDRAWMEPTTLQAMLETIEQHQCGFVGAYPDALVENSEQASGGRWLEIWDGKVEPETVEPSQRGWRRERLHQSRTFTNLSLRVPPGQRYLYKVAYAPGVVLYDRAKLMEMGGFPDPALVESFPSADAAAQNSLMSRYGGCSLLPSGVFQLDKPAVPSVENFIEDLSPETTRAAR